MKFPVSLEKAAELEQRLLNLGVRAEHLQEKFIRASGPGGQKINKTSVAVYLKHLPSGMEIKVQTARSQAMNRFLARRLLADRLEAQHEDKRRAEEQRVAKIRRQKRKRSLRAKNKILAAKQHQAEKKQLRTKVDREEGEKDKD